MANPINNANTPNIETRGGQYVQREPCRAPLS